MLGAIIGDVVGSIYEWDNYRSKEFPFFGTNCQMTDDSVMTLAVAKALLESAPDYTDLPEQAVKWMQVFGRWYPNESYGGMFRQWLSLDHPHPYNSFGNGAAMRVSPCGWAGRTMEEVIWLSEQVTAVTHNHPEGIKGAESVAVAIFLARSGKSLAEIQAFVEEHYYQIDFRLDDIRDTYPFDETCQGTVPQAMAAFFESVDYEDAIRNAISIGGDSDTVAAITGGIAEAYYGIPVDIEMKGMTYFDAYLLAVYESFIAQYVK